MKARHKDTGEIIELAQEGIIAHDGRRLCWHQVELLPEPVDDFRPSLPSDLDEAAENIYKTPFGTRAEDFIAGAEWQEKQDLKWAGEIHKNGYNLCKEQLLKDAVEIEVKEDAGGFPIVPLDAIELYDYENDKPLAKAGDKVKVIVIKEDEK